jgi:hypothetical protein
MRCPCHLEGRSLLSAGLCSPRDMCGPAFEVGQPFFIVPDNLDPDCEVRYNVDHTTISNST